MNRLFHINNLYDNNLQCNNQYLRSQRLYIRILPSFLSPCFNMGEKSGKDFGPVNNRRCHDIFFSILFVAFWVGMFMIAGFAVKNGDVNRLRYGIDSDGNLCGVNNATGLDMSGSPSLYYFNPTAPTTTYKRCLSACPNNTGDVVCKYGVTASADPTTLAGQMDNGDCVFTISSTSMLNRCFPTGILGAVNITQNTQIDLALARLQMGLEMDSREVVQKVFETFHTSWKWMLLCSGVALISSFVWLIVMQLLSGLMVWFTLLSYIAVVSGATAYSWWLYWETIHGRSTELLGFDLLESVQISTKTLLAICIIISVIEAVSLLVLIAMRKRINLAISVIKEASKAIKSMPSIILLPLVKYIPLLALFCWTVFIIAFLATNGSQLSQAFNNVTKQYTGKSFSPSQQMYFLVIYTLMNFYWSWNVIIGLSQITIAGAVGTWYWTREKRNVPFFVILKAFGRGLFYHFGSVALGALLVAIISVIQFILMSLQYRLKGANNAVAKGLLACLQTLCGCLESLMKLMNKNAYIEIAIYGYSFCEGSKHAFSLIAANGLRLFTIDGISSIILFFGKMGITCGTGILGWYLLRRDASIIENYTVPLIFICLFAYIIATAFVNVVDMSIDTIFLCFLEDCEHNDGSAERPYYMPEGLRQHVSKKAAHTDLAH